MVTGLNIHPSGYVMKQACPEMAVEISAYFDDELEPREREAVELHLKDCPTCRASLDSMGKLHSAFSALSAPAPTRANARPILQAVMDMLEKRPKR